MRLVLALALASACGFSHGVVGPSDAAEDGDAPDVDDLGDAQLDASGDAGFDPASCPAEYSLTITSTASRYRGIGVEASFAAQHALCNADQTHLVSLETVEELEELRDVLVNRTLAPSRRYYLGAVQQANQGSETAGWLVFSGSALPASQWSSGQPNDDGGGENNAENRGTLNPDDALNDATGDVAYGAICECDGVPIAPAVAALLQ